MSRLDPEQIELLAKLVAERVMETVQAGSADPRWLTIDEAMVYAKTSKKMLRSWIDEGHIYGFKRTGRYVVDRESIDRWYNSERIDFRRM